MKLLFDIETDGLLDDLTKIHCIVITDIEKKQTYTYTESFGKAFMKLYEADYLIGHNIIGYDIPAIQKINPFFNPGGKIIDTLVLARMIHPKIFDTDCKRGLKHLKGSHSLKAWGERLKFHKGSFHEETDWKEFTPQMLEYCKRDVELNVLLYENLMKHRTPEAAIETEMVFQQHMFSQEQKGACFDVKTAEKLQKNLWGTRVKLEEKLLKELPPRKSFRVFTPMRDNLKKGYVKGVSVKIVKEHPANPNSRQQVIEYFKEQGWTPTKFTEKGNPKIDDEVLSKMEYKNAREFQRLFEVNKLLGQLSEGDNAWLKLVRNGRIHGRVITIGTRTHRCSHVAPNLAQVPSIGAFMGKECRELFTAPAGKVVVGADASGIELRMLAHYLYPYDGGEYTELVTKGDVHTRNQEAAGLKERSQAKRFIYCLIYGGGDVALGDIIAPEGTLQYRKTVGKNARMKFMAKIPGIRDLMKDVEKAFKTRGYLKGIDGRLLVPKSNHTCLNTILQSSAAIIMKKATNIFWDTAIAAKAEPMLHVHDEIQIVCETTYSAMIGDSLVESIKRSGYYYNLKCLLDGEYKVGQSWAETH